MNPEAAAPQNGKRLFWLDLTHFHKKPEGEVATLDHQLAQSSAPLLSQAFGDDPKWLSYFLKHAISGQSVAFVQDNNVLGACYVSDTNFPTISAICIDSNWRRQGWASQLLMHSLHRLKKKSFPTVVAHIQESNIGSTQLFQNHGFQMVDSIEQLLRLGRAAGGLQRNCIHYLPNDDSLAVQEACREAQIPFLS